MQGIVDSCVSAAESIDHREVTRQEYRRQLIEELESDRPNRNRYPAIASILERDARGQGKIDQYAELIRSLGDPAVNERVEAEVATALRALWGVS